MSTTIWVARFGPKMGQIGPKWDKFGTLSDQIFPLGTKEQSDSIWVNIWHACLEKLSAGEQDLSSSYLSKEIIGNHCKQEGNQGGQIWPKVCQIATKWDKLRTFS